MQFRTALQLVTLDATSFGNYYYWSHIYQASQLDEDEAECYQLAIIYQSTKHQSL